MNRLSFSGPYDRGMINFGRVWFEADNLCLQTAFFYEVRQIFSKRALVISQGNNIRINFFNYRVGIADIAKHRLIDKITLLNCFQAQQLASLWKSALNFIHCHVPANNHNQAASQFFGLLEEINVAGMEAVKSTECQNFFHKNLRPASCARASCGSERLSIFLFYFGHSAHV